MNVPEGSKHQMLSRSTKYLLGIPSQHTLSTKAFTWIVADNNTRMRTCAVLSIELFLGSEGRSLLLRLERLPAAGKLWRSPTRFIELLFRVRRRSS